MSTTDTPATDWRTLWERRGQLDQMLREQSDEDARSVLIGVRATIGADLMRTPVTDAYSAIMRLELAAEDADLGEVDGAPRTVAETLREVTTWLAADRTAKEREERDFVLLIAELKDRFSAERKEGLSDAELQRATERTGEIAKLIMDTNANTLVGYGAKARVVAWAQSEDEIRFENGSTAGRHAATILNELKALAS